MRMPELLAEYVVNGRAVELSCVPSVQAGKRLSDAELAAEFWAPAYIHFLDPAFFDGDFDEIEAAVKKRTETILRFVLNPHEFPSPATTRAHA